ncbi:MAG: hypothetical protein Q9218_005479 [Villophora microphyllina]
MPPRRNKTMTQKSSDRVQIPGQVNQPAFTRSRSSFTIQHYRYVKSAIVADRLPIFARIPQIPRTPRLIRLIVYGYALLPDHNPETIRWKKNVRGKSYGFRQRTGNLSNLLLANRQIKDEASSVLFEEGFFHFDVWDSWIDHYQARKPPHEDILDPHFHETGPARYFRPHQILAKVRNIRITLNEVVFARRENSGDVYCSNMSQAMTILCEALSQKCPRLKNVVVEVVCRCPVRRIVHSPPNDADYVSAPEDFTSRMNSFLDLGLWRGLWFWEAEIECFHVDDFDWIIQPLHRLRLSGNIELITSCTQAATAELHTRFEFVAASVKSKAAVQDLTAFEKVYFDVRNTALPFLAHDETTASNLSSAWLNITLGRLWDDVKREETAWSKIEFAKKCVLE